MSFVDQFVSWANKCLQDDDDAQAFLRGRGCSEEQWEKFQLGFVGGEFRADPSVDPGHGPDCEDRENKSKRCDSCKYNTWSSSWESVEDQPAKKQIYAGRIKGCVVYPLTSYSGTTVGFQVRSIKEKSYDTFAIKRRPEAFFFGIGPQIERIWETKRVSLVEGAHDALIIDRLLDIPALALTTNATNKLQNVFLRRYVENVDLLLDLDPPGRHGTASFIEFQSTNFNIRDIDYKMSIEGKDIGDYWKRVGDEKLRRHLLNVMGR